MRGQRFSSARSRIIFAPVCLLNQISPEVLTCLVGATHIAHPARPSPLSNRACRTLRQTSRRCFRTETTSYIPVERGTGMTKIQGKRASKRVAIYLRVSTAEQTTTNQRRELHAVAKRHGWCVVQVFEDAGISGAKGRKDRPALDALLSRAPRSGLGGGLVCRSSYGQRSNDGLLLRRMSPVVALLYRPSGSLLRSLSEVKRHRPATWVQSKLTHKAVISAGTLAGVQRKRALWQTFGDVWASARGSAPLRRAKRAGARAARRV